MIKGQLCSGLWVVALFGRGQVGHVVCVWLDEQWPVSHAEGAEQQWHLAVPMQRGPVPDLVTS